MLLSVSSGTCVSDEDSSGLEVPSAEVSVWLSVCAGTVLSAGTSVFLPQADIIILPAASRIARLYACLFFMIITLSFMFLYLSLFQNSSKTGDIGDSMLMVTFW